MRFLFLVGLVGIGCVPNDEPVCTHEPALTYDNFGKGFTDQFCTGCHSSIIPEEQRMGAPEAYDFDTYEGIVYWADKLWEPVEGGEMPPGGGPTDVQKKLYGEWVQCDVLPDAEIYWYED